MLDCPPCAKRPASYLKSTGCAAKGFCSLTSLHSVLTLFFTNPFHRQLQFGRTHRPLRNFAIGSKSIRGNVRVMCRIFSGIEYCLFVLRVLKCIQLFHLKGCSLVAVQNVNRNHVYQNSQPESCRSYPTPDTVSFLTRGQVHPVSCAAALFIALAFALHRVFCLHIIIIFSNEARSRLVSVSWCRQQRRQQRWPASHYRSRET